MKQNYANKDEFEYLRNNAAFHEDIVDVKYHIDMLRKDVNTATHKVGEVDSVFRNKWAGLKYEIRDINEILMNKADKESLEEIQKKYEFYLIFPYRT